MKIALGVAVALQFAHYPFQETNLVWDVFYLSQGCSMIALLFALYGKIRFEHISDKSCCLVAWLWISVSLILNGFCSPDWVIHCFDLLCSLSFVRQLTIKPFKRESDKYDAEHAFYLVSPPKDNCGVFLTLYWMALGNRMLVEKGNLYYIKRWRFVKRKFHEQHLMGRTLIDTGRKADGRCAKLEGRRAIPLIYDCARFEAYGKITKLTRREK